jgi:hypothetical protein
VAATGGQWLRRRPTSVDASQVGSGAAASPHHRERACGRQCQIPHLCRLTSIDGDGLDLRTQQGSFTIGNPGRVILVESGNGPVGPNGLKGEDKWPGAGRLAVPLDG